MPGPDFLTISDDLLHVANDVYSHFDDLAYDLEVEPSDPGFPVTPALVARRGHERVIVEVISEFDPARLRRWVGYCKSQTEDTRLCVVCLCPEGVHNRLIDFAAANGVGLYAHDDDHMMEVRAPIDLAVHATLPDLKDLRRSVRTALAPAFKKFASEDWRDGLFAAYSEVEQNARDYLSDGVANGRIVVERPARRGTRVAVSAEEIDKMPLGPLAQAFGQITAPTHKDARIHQTLSLINQTRIGLTHKRKKAEVEREIRAHVGQHIHAVTGCLEDLLP